MKAIDLSYSSSSALLCANKHFVYPFLQYHQSNLSRVVQLASLCLVYASFLSSMLSIKVLRHEKTIFSILVFQSLQKRLPLKYSQKGSGSKGFHTFFCSHFGSFVGLVPPVVLFKAFVSSFFTNKKKLKIKNDKILKLISIFPSL